MNAHNQIIVLVAI